ncbi:DUF5134 domain-containing protein [Streptomyces jumonjinensis]|uniref:DUF5134 domain-containing protein n=1 Tax=Streptomyces jumonjinensis TaxID=1945 RepID=UPI0037AF3795
MHGPVVSGWLLVALCAWTGGYCLARLRRCPRRDRAAVGGEALMGLGMAAMAVPAAVFTPPGWVWPVYAAVFGGAALGALWSALRGAAHHLHHAVGSLSMVYMALVMAYGTGHRGHTAAGVPVVTGALLAYYAVYVLHRGLRLVPALPGPLAVAPGPVPMAGLAPGTGPVTPGAGRIAAGAAPPCHPAQERNAGMAPACRLVMGLATLAMLFTL